MLRDDHKQLLKQVASTKSVKALGMKGSFFFTNISEDSDAPIRRPRTDASGRDFRHATLLPSGPLPALGVPALGVRRRHVLRKNNAALQHQVAGKPAKKGSKGVPKGPATSEAASKADPHPLRICIIAGSQTGA